MAGVSRRRRSAWCALGLGAALAVVPSPALAYRPFDGTDADTAAYGDFELELGPVHWYTSGGSRYLIAPATVLNLGYLPGWELVADFQNFVGLDAARGQPRDRILDTDLLTKGVLLRGVLQDAGPRPSIAAEFGPLLPEAGGDRGFGASCDVIVSERFAGFTFHWNDWLELARGSLKPDLFEGLILEGPYDLPIRPVAEIFVDHSWDARTTTFSALAGAIWRAHDDVDLDVGVREATDGATRTTEIRLGLTWTIGVFRPANPEARGQNGRLPVAFGR